MPLIGQLAERASYIMKRLAEVVESEMKEQAKHTGNG